MDIARRPPLLVATPQSVVDLNRNLWSAGIQIGGPGWIRTSNQEIMSLLH